MNPSNWVPQQFCSFPRGSIAPLDSSLTSLTLRPMGSSWWVGTCFSILIQCSFSWNLTLWVLPLFLIFDHFDFNPFIRLHYYLYYFHRSNCSMLEFAYPHCLAVIGWIESKTVSLHWSHQYLCYPSSHFCRSDQAAYVEQGQNRHLIKLFRGQPWVISHYLHFLSWVSLQSTQPADELRHFHSAA